MALSNAERQRKYRQLRNERAKDANFYLTKVEYLEAQVRTLTAERDLLRNELEVLRNNSRKAKSKPVKTIPFLARQDAFFYVEHGELTLLQWPETIGTVKARGLELVSVSKIDRKYAKQIDKQIEAYNLEVERLNQLEIDVAIANSIVDKDQAARPAVSTARSDARNGYQGAISPESPWGFPSAEQSCPFPQREGAPLAGRVPARERGGLLFVVLRISITEKIKPRWRGAQNRRQLIPADYDGVKWIIRLKNKRRKAPLVMLPRSVHPHLR